MDYGELMKAKHPKPDNGGQAVPVIPTAEIVEKVRDPATGVEFPIKPGITGEKAITEWEKENGDISEPAYKRQQKKKETGEI
ncbi:MAG: hypothetical protein US68_C0004G0018 [Candidatus Shapirobacteria bacterium GW2011_GWE1_38_10]|uniref:Uncharacterized protein n=1 Tax=Candidatus Shapirobacteria bacterium GW2011_GWE1_38_10 TaxID=1618488 RepID=A0A0G0LD12_9BACT|nr:MAG: hypothetical protein US46_C0005G0034 [Candidatus Shapirobacteria bacterium GW2011_GWF2_37_20]KKQ50536.1 MAG: hypothetical protein US68_C0004G0018 [Candidatus Shapirobacteria bacterium GW2011_GWE1_38_10]KKQ64677.1 MAG: hypothetical protein US85_C0005G0025 [Candidatus Shapirobacteria bacterium GW2011_GWF1_38_23]